MDRIGCTVCSDSRCQKSNFAIESLYIVNEEEFKQIV